MRKKNIFILIIFLILVAITGWLYKTEDIKKERIFTATAALTKARESKNEEDIILAEKAINKVKTSDKEDFINNLEKLKEEIEKERILEEYFKLIDDANSKNNLEDILLIIKDIENITYEDIRRDLSDKAMEVKVVIEKEIERKRQEALNNRLLKIDKNPPVSRSTGEISVIETFSGTMTAYTPYCDGCRGYTASGKFIGDGDIYYNDREYGSVRIVAGDSSYPFGTIVRIRGYGSDIYAVVLDRGGEIGKGRRAMFDLLFATKTYAYQFGVKYNLEFDILRLGY